MRSRRVAIRCLLVGLLFVPLLAIASDAERRPLPARDVDHRMVPPVRQDPVLRPTQLLPVTGKAGIDRFEVDMGKVRESVKADGTVIVQLNGEGLEKMVLGGIPGAPAAVCESMLETRLLSTSLPDDFRDRALSSKGPADGHH